MNIYSVAKQYNKKIAQISNSDKVEVAIKEEERPYYKITSIHKPGTFESLDDTLLIKKETAERWQRIYDAFMQMQSDIEVMKYEQIGAKVYEKRSLSDEELESYDDIYNNIA